LLTRFSDPETLQISPDRREQLAEIARALEHAGRL
jgi:hypothetical protein